jgi:predicted MFS family arabinose efflux permease
MALEVSHRGGWTAPFYVVASLIALVCVAAAWILPAMRAHLSQEKTRVTPRSLLAQPAVRAACAIQALSQFSAFLIIPHFSAYFLLNLGFPRDQLGLLYLLGGLASLFAVQVAGRLNDKIGAMPVLIVAVLCFALGLTPFFGWAGWTLLLPFVLFMVSNAIRNVTLATVCSQVPAASERAGFMSLQNMVQDVAIASAALVSSVLLSTTASGQLSGMSVLASMALLSALILPWAMSVLLRRAPLELEAA